MQGARMKGGVPPEVQVLHGKEETQHASKGETKEAGTLQFSDGKPSACQDAAHHDSDAEPEPEQRDLSVIGQLENA